jgi:hypothetical protein
MDATLAMAGGGVMAVGGGLVLVARWRRRHQAA